MVRFRPRQGAVRRLRGLCAARLTRISGRRPRWPIRRGASRPCEGWMAKRPALPGRPQSSAEFSRELLRLAREHHRVEADRGEHRAPFDIAACRGFVGGEDSRGLAAGTDARDRVLDGRLHLGVPGFAEVSETGGKVGWPYADALEPS